MSPTAQRIIGALVLLVVGILSLPVVAFFLDGPSTENLIIPVQLILVALVGALLTTALPALAPAGASSTTRILAGAGWGVLAGLLGVLVFFFLLNGFGGA